MLYVSEIYSTSCDILQTPNPVMNVASVVIAIARVLELVILVQCWIIHRKKARNRQKNSHFNDERFYNSSEAKSENYVAFQVINWSRTLRIFFIQKISVPITIIRTIRYGPIRRRAVITTLATISAVAFKRYYKTLNYSHRSLFFDSHRFSAYLGVAQL